MYNKQYTTKNGIQLQVLIGKNQGDGIPRMKGKLKIVDNYPILPKVTETWDELINRFRKGI